MNTYHQQIPIIQNLLIITMIFHFIIWLYTKDNNKKFAHGDYW